MRVELTAAHIPTGSQGDLLRVIALWWMAHEGRHRVLLAAADREPWLAWIQKQEPLLKEAIEGALAASEAADAYGPALSPTVVVGFQQPWVGERLGLSLIDALEVLSQPLRVLVEDAVTDRHFLLAFADPPTRKALLLWEERGWLRFQHSGGKGRILNWIANANSKSITDNWCLRLYIVMDSDRKKPPETNGTLAALKKPQSEINNEIETHANRAGVEERLLGAILKMGEAENYAPTEYLLRRVTTYRQGKEELRAWKQASSQERCDMARKSHSIDKYGNTSRTGP